MSHFTALTTLELTFRDKHANLSRKLALLSQICASLSSPCLEKLRFVFSCQIRSIPAIYASLANLRAVDTVLSLPQFSRLSDVTFECHVMLLLKDEPTTFGHHLMKTPSESLNADDEISTSESPGPLRSDNLPSGAYFMDEIDGTPRLSSSYLEEFLEHRAEGQLHQLQHRDILTTKMTITIGRQTIDEFDVVDSRFSDGTGMEDMVGEFYESDDECHQYYEDDVDEYYDEDDWLQGDECGFETEPEDSESGLD